MPIKKKGDVIDGYRVLAEVGRGAASVIYLVQEIKTKQIWALKQVEKHTDKDQRFLDQAEEEAKVAQAVNHPGIRKIKKVFKKGSFLAVKELVLVMEFVDGVNLRQLMELGRLSPAEALRITPLRPFQPCTKRGMSMRT